MLASRVALIRDYVKAVEAGELTLNHDIIREAQSLAARLPVLQADLFQPQFYNQCNDAALMTLMGSVQKSCNNLQLTEFRLSSCSHRAFLNNSVSKPKNPNIPFSGLLFIF